MKTNQHRLRSASRFHHAAMYLLLGFIATSGCNKKAQDMVVIRGSNTVGEELAPRLIAEFKRDHPSVAFDTEFKGTPYGFGALMVQRCDIAAASREVTTNELALASERGIQFNDYVIGSYDVGVIVNEKAGVADLTRDQIRDVFTGTIKNWKDLGGQDAEINLYVRDPISGTHIGFQELAMDRKPYALHVKTFTNYTAIVHSVAQDPHGMGYTSIDLSKSPGIKMVSVGGIAPTSATVNQGSYPYSRLLRLYTNKAHESTAAAEFVQFVRSDRGQKILSEMGFIPKL